MDQFSTRSRIVITCHRGLAPWVELELRGLGFHDTVVFHGGVSFEGTLEDCIRLNLRLRCASQVLFSLRQFRCTGPDELYLAVSSVPWEQWIDPAGYFTVYSNVVHPSIRSGMFANVRVKDAVVDRIRRKAGRRPDTGAEMRGVVVWLFWRNDRAEVFLDTSGETLARHGYRKMPGAAPMVEALAAATILAGNWDQRSPFVNPMCGAGTLAIEAALIATGRFPGLYRRSYAFMHLLGHPAVFFQSVRQELESAVHPVEGLEIIASDISAGAVETAGKNAAAAGVESLIRFQTCDFSGTEIPTERPGVVFFNPEYGERLGEETELAATYSRIGDFLKHRCGGWTGYVFTGNLELAKKIGLRAKRKIAFQTARIDCRLLEFELYAGSRKNRSPQPGEGPDDPSTGAPSAAAAEPD